MKRNSRSEGLHKARRPGFRDRKSDSKSHPTRGAGGSSDSFEVALLRETVGFHNPTRQRGTHQVLFFAHPSGYQKSTTSESVSEGTEIIEVRSRYTRPSPGLSARRFPWVSSLRMHQSLCRTIPSGHQPRLQSATVSANRNPPHRQSRR